MYCRGDLTVIERIAYEFVEDQSRESVAYCEARFSPHLLLPNQETQPNFLQNEGEIRLNGTVDGINDSEFLNITERPFFVIGISFVLFFLEWQKMTL